MSDYASAVRVQIERLVRTESFRGTPYAEFKRTDGWFICDAWFEGTEPRSQIRSLARSLEEISQVIAGLQLAQEWLHEQVVLGKNIPKGIVMTDEEI